MPEALAAAGGAAEGLVFVQVDLNQPTLHAALQRLFHDSSASSVTYGCYIALAAVLEASRGITGPVTPASAYHALAALPRIRLADRDVPLRERETELKMQTMVVQGNTAVPAD